MRLTTSSGAPMPRLSAKSAMAPRTILPLWPHDQERGDQRRRYAGRDNQRGQRPHDGDATEAAGGLAIARRAQAGLDCRGHLDGEQAHHGQREHHEQRPANSTMIQGCWNSAWT